MLGTSDLSVTVDITEEVGGLHEWFLQENRLEQVRELISTYGLYPDEAFAEAFGDDPHVQAAEKHLPLLQALIPYEVWFELSQSFSEEFADLDELAKAADDGGE